MRVVHRRLRIVVAQKFLHGSDLVPLLKEVSRKAMSEDVTADALVKSCQAGRLADSFLQSALAYMMATHNPALRVVGRAFRGKDIA